MRFWIIQITALVTLPLLALATTPPLQASTDPELRQMLKEAIESDSGFEDRFDAQVWLLDMSRRLEKFIEEPKTRIDLLKLIHYEARRVGIEPELVLAVIEVESRFDEFAISVSGARGLMQIMPFWLNEIGISDQNLFKIRTNLRMGCTICTGTLQRQPWQNHLSQ
jgi:soluble lytic murein transglycosylase-like protein